MRATAATAVGPGGGGGQNVIHDTLLRYKRERKFEKTQTTKIRLVVYNDLSCVHKNANDPMVGTHIAAYGLDKMIIKTAKLKR